MQAEEARMESRHSTDCRQGECVCFGGRGRAVTGGVAWGGGCRLMKGYAAYPLSKSTQNARLSQQLRQPPLTPTV